MSAVHRQTTQAVGQVELVDALPHAVWSALPDGTIEFLNERWYEYTATARQLSPHAAWTEALVPEQAAAAIASWQQAIRAGCPFELELRLRAADGGARWFQARGCPLRGEDGSVARWVGTWTDVESRRRLETELRETDRRKDQFLALLGHELRNPLAAIRNGLQVTQLKEATAEQAAAARRVIERQVEHMVRLIDDLLDVNRVVAGQVALRAGELDLREPLRHAIEDCRARAGQRRQTLQVDLPAEPLRVRADGARLQQAFLKLLENAMKFSDPGSTVRVALARERDTAAVRFRDRGIGIAAADLARVFEPFVQLDPERARADGGLGIGLTLVRHLAELHGGRVEVTSDGPGLGSEFTVRLPALAAASGVDERALYRARPRAAGQRVLVADDNADSAQSLSLLLNLLGNDVCTAADGMEALERAEQFRPQVALLDLGMPRMDGYEAARRLRSQPWARELLLVAMTGWSQDEDRARSRDAGFDHHLVKPVDPRLLDELLQARGRGGAAAPTAQQRL